MSNRDRLIVQNIVRNGSLWSNVNWFLDLRFWNWDLEIKHLKAHNFAWQGCFSVIIISQLRRPILSSNFHRFVIVCLCWDTLSERNGLWQLPIVSSVFKPIVRFQKPRYLNNFPFILKQVFCEIVSRFNASSESALGNLHDEPPLLCSLLLKCDLLLARTLRWH